MCHSYRETNQCINALANYGTFFKFSHPLICSCTIPCPSWHESSIDYTIKVNVNGTSLNNFGTFKFGGIMLNNFGDRMISLIGIAISMLVELHVIFNIAINLVVQTTSHITFIPLIKHNSKT
jgi:hypothetical protein